MTPPRERKPWPMKWVVLAIAVFILGYTYLNLRYRKPVSFEPYEDARERARIASVGYRRVSLNLRQPAGNRLVPSAGPVPVPGGLPADLYASLIEKPRLPESIGAVSAAPSLESGDLYRVRFRCASPGVHLQLGSAHLYQKSGVLYLVVGYVPIIDELAVRDTRTEVLLTAPANSVKSGRYRVVLVGRRESKAWPLIIR
ncbi:MAG: hypothetical protein ACREFX_14970 [Opitutaceae bacterium]